MLSLPLIPSKQRRASPCTLLKKDKEKLALCHLHFTNQVLKIKKKWLGGGEIFHLNIANDVKPECPPTTAYVCGGWAGEMQGRGDGIKIPCKNKCLAE